VGCRGVLVGPGRPRARSWKVEMHGRDAQDTQRLARRWRSLANRDPSRSVADGRVEQCRARGVGRTLKAAQAGSAGPTVVTAAARPRRGPRSSSRGSPDIEPLENSSPEDVSDETLLWGVGTRPRSFQAAGHLARTPQREQRPRRERRGRCWSTCPPRPWGAAIRPRHRRAELLVALAVLASGRIAANAQGPDAGLGDAVAAGPCRNRQELP
jgi:hypothetical protein